jgi:hypothetical protein
MHALPQQMALKIGKKIRNHLYQRGKHILYGDLWGKTWTKQTLCKLIWLGGYMRRGSLLKEQRGATWFGAWCSGGGTTVGHHGGAPRWGKRWGTKVGTTMGHQGRVPRWGTTVGHTVGDQGATLRWGVKVRHQGGALRCDTKVGH